MDQFLEQVFDDVRLGDLGKDEFIEAIALVMTAIDIGEREEALRLLRAKKSPAALWIVK